MRVLQWVWMIEVKVAELKLPLETQLGSWLYHTQLCPRRSCPFVLARFAIWSPPENVNVPRSGSVASCTPQALRLVCPAGFV